MDDGLGINCQLSEAWERVALCSSEDALSNYRLTLLSQLLLAEGLMLPCCLSLDEVTVQGFTCSLPLVPDSQFQQERDFVYPILCCLPEDLLHSRNSVFSQQRQAFPNPTPRLTPSTSK